MRPVERGNPPKRNGEPVVFAHYRDARDYLVGRLGDYCSYCELPCNEGPGVEHVQPKAHDPGSETTWDNLLLACCYCNSIKGRQPVDLGRYYWPDVDNTLRAFVYARDRAPQPATWLADDERVVAQASLALTGLDREPGHPRLTRRDTRWLKRRTAWSKALLAKQRLAMVPEPAFRDQIVDTAASTGFWSVWMAVFADDADMRRRFVEAFPGTCGVGEAFDDELESVRRPGGRV